MRNYLNLIYQNSFTPTVNTSPRVTRKTSVIIDNILTNSFVNTNFKTFIFKIDISDHFPICFLLHILPKESSTIAQSNCLNKNYIKPVIKTTKIRMMDTITFHTSLLFCTIIIFQNKI